jgi:hypothetical protein
MTATLRYTLRPNVDFGAFVYAGLNKNFVGSSVNATDAGKDQLSSILPAVGIGLLFRVGPSWYMRVDGGLDIIALSLSLHF